jgi:hypothetical protein
VVASLQIGAVLSQRYRVARVLFDGDTATVYEAIDVARSQRVWVKMLRREAAADREAFERFQNEATGPDVYDVGRADGLPFVVTSNLRAAMPQPMVPRPASSPTKKTLMGIAPPSNGSRPVALDAADLLEEDTVAATTSPFAATDPGLEPPTLLQPAPLQARSPFYAEVPMTQPQPMNGWPAVVEEPVEPRRAKPFPFAWAGAMVALATLTGAGGWYLGHRSAPVVVVSGPAAPSSVRSALPAVSVAAPDKPAREHEPEVLTPDELPSASPPPATTSKSVSPVTRAPLTGQRRPSQPTPPVNTSSDPLTL